MSQNLWGVAQDFRYAISSLLLFMYTDVFGLLAESVQERLLRCGRWELSLVLKDGEEQDDFPGREEPDTKAERRLSKVHSVGSGKSNMDGAHGISWGIWKKLKRAFET